MQKTLITVQILVHSNLHEDMVEEAVKQLVKPYLNITQSSTSGSYLSTQLHEVAEVEEVLLDTFDIPNRLRQIFERSNINTKAEALALSRTQLYKLWNFGHLAMTQYNEVFGTDHRATD